MSHLIRHRAACGGVLLAAFLAASLFANGQIIKQPRQQEDLLLGPLALGELYLKMGKADRELYGNALPKSSGLTEKQIVEALNHCQVYVLEHRRKPDQGGEWTFLEGEKDRPIVLVTGQFSFELKNARGTEFRFHVREVSVSDTNTDFPKRDGAFIVDLCTDPYERDLGDEVKVQYHRFNFRTQYLTWDLKGAFHWKGSTEN